MTTLANDTAGAASTAPDPTADLDTRTAGFREHFAHASREIGRVIVGYGNIVEGVLLCLVAGGHVLLEGVPGLGKTLLVRTLSEVLDLSFSRIQFTPDLMPADITGTNILVEEDGRRQFQFQPGPVFAQIVLADEINRATPKTQSAMLEAMQEKSVTVAGKMRRLQEPFFVLATQNPIEMEGTYPLPEAQLDRFLFNLIVPSPTLADLATILDRTTGAETPTVSVALNGGDIKAMRELARAVPIAPHVRDYAASLILASHPENASAPPVVRQFVRVGSSPRGAQAIVLTAKIKAILAGRYNVAIEDINTVAVPALRHRILLNFEGEAEGIETADVVQKIIESESTALQKGIS
ncbi:MAG: AAA family ATPase [Cytophagales bacterium]|nr:AAA family ATPase [Armatimonadota bacterium]